MTENIILYVSSYGFETFFVCAILAGIIFFTFIDNQVKNSQMTSSFSIFLLFLLILINLNGIDDAIVLYNNSLIFDNLSKYGKTLICLTSLICLLGGAVFTNKSKIAFEYYFVFLFAIFAMCLLLSSYDFLTIYLAIELQSLSLYILAAMRKDNVYSVEAALKYFVLGSLASGFLVFGMSIIYGLTGISNLNEFSVYLSSLYLEDLHSLTLMFGISLFFCGLLFKIGAAPFHMWVPDVYEGSPANVTLFFGVVPKLAVILFLVRICNLALIDYSLFWTFVFILSSSFSVILGSLGGLAQLKIKRLLAFSSINQVGYILLGLVALTNAGTSSVVLYIILYAFTTIVFWFMLFSLKKVNFKQIYDTNIVQYITDLTNLSKINYSLALSFMLVLFSIGGVPPLGGFFSKAYLFFAAIDSQLIAPLVIAVLCSMVAIFYYLRFAKILYFRGKQFNNIYYEAIPTEYSIVIALFTLLIGTFMLTGDFLITLSYVMGLFI